MATAQLGAVLRHIRNLPADQKTNEQTDGELIRAFMTRKDQAAFEIIVKRHGPMVLQVCRGVLGNVHDAEDAFQATFLVLAQQSASIRKKESLASWLHGVAYRMATNARRAAARRRKHEQQASPTQAADPALRAAWQELQALLDEEIEGLPESFRGPFVLCCLENKSSAEAARELGLQDGTVRNRLARARKQLQERLTRRGVSLTAALAGAAVTAEGTRAAMPRSLVSSTVKAAGHVAAGQALTGSLVPANVITLVEGANQAMFLTKAKVATAVLLVASLLVAGTGVLSHQTLAANQADPQASKVSKPSPKGSEQPVPGGEGKSSPAVSKGDKKDRISVKGRVVGPDGKPFAGAKLYLGGYTSPKERKYPVRATSGDDGRFAFTFAKAELEQLDADDLVYQVLAVAKGHGCAWVTAGSAAEELTLRLVKDVPVIGRILDADGKPVAGAKLTLTGVCAKGSDAGGFVELVRVGLHFRYAFGMGWIGPLPGQPAVLTTGADGKFRLAGVGRDRVVSLLLEGRGIATAALGANGASFEHHAAVSRPIRGVVRDKATGKPLPGVTVLWQDTYNRRYEVIPWRQRKAITDKEGRYELLGVAKSSGYANYLAVRPAEGQLYLQRTLQLKDTPGLDPMTVDIELLRGGVTVRGKVTDKATGKPVAQALVEYVPLYANPHAGKLSSSYHPRSEATTGLDGSYTLTVLPGQGVIRAVGTNKPDVYMEAFLTSKEIKDFFKTPLFGKGDDMLWSVGGNAFTFLPDGDCHALVLLEPGEKEEGLVKDVALERALERKGRVIGPDGQPLTGVTVRGLSSRWYVEETLKGDEFTVRGLNPGATRQLVFHHKDKNLGVFLRELPREKAGPLTVQLQRCGSISGRLMDPDGQPLAAGRIKVAPNGLNPGVGQNEVAADKEGRFRAEGLIPGMTYELTRRNVAGVRYEMARGLASVRVEPGKNKDVGDLKVLH